MGKIVVVAQLVIVMMEVEELGETRLRDTIPMTGCWVLSAVPLSDARTARREDLSVNRFGLYVDVDIRITCCCIQIIRSFMNVWEAPDMVAVEGEKTGKAVPSRDN